MHFTSDPQILKTARAQFFPHRESLLDNFRVGPRVDERARRRKIHQRHQIEIGQRLERCDLGKFLKVAVWQVGKVGAAFLIRVLIANSDKIERDNRPHWLARHA